MEHMGLIKKREKLSETHLQLNLAKSCFAINFFYNLHDNHTAVPCEQFGKDWSTRIDVLVQQDFNLWWILMNSPLLWAPKLLANFPWIMSSYPWIHKQCSALYSKTYKKRPLNCMVPQDVAFHNRENKHNFLQALSHHSTSSYPFWD